MEVTGRSAESLEILARALHVKNAELEPTLEAIASTAVTMLSPARYAGLTILSRGELIPRATTGEPPLLLDRLQQRLGDGPCISAAKHQSVFRIEDTLQDPRWPEFSAEAARLRCAACYACRSGSMSEAWERSACTLTRPRPSAIFTSGSPSCWPRSRRSRSLKHSALTRCTTRSATGTLSGRPRAS